MQLVHGEGAVRALACHGAPLCSGANPIPRNPTRDLTQSLTPTLTLTLSFTPLTD